MPLTCIGAGRVGRTVGRGLGRRVFFGFGAEAVAVAFGTCGSDGRKSCAAKNEATSGSRGISGAGTTGRGRGRFVAFGFGAISMMTVGVASEGTDAELAGTWSSVWTST